MAIGIGSESPSSWVILIPANTNSATISRAKTNAIKTTSLVGLSYKGGWRNWCIVIWSLVWILPSLLFKDKMIIGLFTITIIHVVLRVPLSYVPIIILQMVFLVVIFIFSEKEKAKT